MVPEELKPKKIRDIISRSEEYLTAMRGMEDRGAEFFVFLQEYIKDYIENEKDNLKLKVLGVELTDLLYLVVSILTLRDAHTTMYYTNIIGYFFRLLAGRKVLFFYVLDNTLRDDRFRLTIELYEAAGFSVVYPYNLGDLDFSEKYTKLQTRDYKAIEKEIDAAREKKEHILYVEKDSSVNYLDDVLHLAEEFQGEYECVFRNKGPAEEQTAQWLKGSFGDWLKINEK